MNDETVKAIQYMLATWRLIRRSAKTDLGREYANGCIHTLETVLMQMSQMTFEETEIYATYKAAKAVQS